MGWGGVKLIISNVTLSHAHSHPRSHNISNIFDGESCATTQANNTYVYITNVNLRMSRHEASGTEESNAENRYFKTAPSSSTFKRNYTPTVPRQASAAISNAFAITRQAEVAIWRALAAPRNAHIAILNALLYGLIRLVGIQIDL